MEIQIKEEKQILSAKDVYEILSTLLSKEDEFDQDKEHFWTVGLDSKNKIKYIELVYLGTATHCVCRASEIYRRACASNAINAIVAHNLCGAPHKLCYVKRRVMCSNSNENYASSVDDTLPSSITAHNSVA